MVITTALASSEESELRFGATWKSARGILKLELVRIFSMVQAEKWINTLLSNIPQKQFINFSIIIIGPRFLFLHNHMFLCFFHLQKSPFKMWDGLSTKMKFYDKSLGDITFLKYLSRHVYSSLQVLKVKQFA